MAGQAAKITFNGEGSRNPQIACRFLDRCGPDHSEGKRHSDGFRQAKQLGHRSEAQFRTPLRWTVEAAMATLVRCSFGY